MSSSSAAAASCDWSKLPEGLLMDIAHRMDSHFDVLRLRAVCQSWRSSLSPQPSDNPSSDSIHPSFPLSLPSPVYPATSFYSDFFPPSHYSLHQTTLYRLSPAWDDSAFSWLIRVSETKPQTFSILYPLVGKKIYSFPDCMPRSINLLCCRISRITHFYDVEGVGPGAGSSPWMPSPIKKVVLGKDFFKAGDLVVLGLTVMGELALWRLGDQNWTWIVGEGRHFNDIISFKGKFYATSGSMGTLVMIDSRLKPVEMVKDLMYENGLVVHLVESGSNLYLVDQVGGIMKLSFDLYKLDEKGWLWDYAPHLEDDQVLFLCEGGNFSISARDYLGCRGNCICFCRRFDETLVFDVGQNNMIPAQNHASLFWPPPGWLRMVAS